MKSNCLYAILFVTVFYCDIYAYFWYICERGWLKLDKLVSFFSELWVDLVSQMKMMTGNDILDIGILALVLYFVYRFIRNRRAGKLAVGVLFVLILLVLSEFLQLNAMRFLLKNIVQVGIIALLVLFQPELRAGLEKVGSEPLRGIKGIKEKSLARYNEQINEICRAVNEMSRSKTGALIVFERETKLGDIINTGVEIDSKINSFLIRNVFYEGAPLHDGAMVVSGFRLVAANCYLPLSSNPDITKEVGTRHRAAIGMSEASDAIVVVVSEETGIISVAQGGVLSRNYNYSTLFKRLSRELLPQEAKARQSKRRGENGEKEEE